MAAIAWQVAKSQKGLTLVELMVTVAVLAIVLTIAVPSFSGIIAANRLTGPANEALSALHFARSEAIRLNRSIDVCKSNAAGTACDANAGAWPGVLVIRPAAAAGQAVVLRQIMFDPALVVNGRHALIRFNAEGFIRAANNTAISGTLRICSTAQQLTQNARDLEYVSGGRVSLARRAASGCPAP